MSLKTEKGCGLQERFRGDAYYTDRTAFSNSMFSKLEENEVLFDKWYKENTLEPVNNVFAVGQYLHDYMARMIVPSYVSESEFIFIPDLDMRKKINKEKIDELLKDVDTSRVYQVKEFDKLRTERLADDFLRSDMFQKLLSYATSIDVEKAYMKPKNDLMLKGKLDLEIMIEDTRFIIDWKSSSNYSSFRNKAYSYGYNRQSACYSYIADADSFSFVVFDTINFNRWKVCKVDFDGAFYKQGMNKLDSSIDRAKDYLKNGINSNLFKTEVL